MIVGSLDMLHNIATLSSQFHESGDLGGGLLGHVRADLGEHGAQVGAD